MPNNLGRDRSRYPQEWEPREALTNALGDMPPPPGTERNGDLAKLEPCLQEALATLERLERQRGLSEREKTRAGALRMLLSSIDRVRQ